MEAPRSLLPNVPYTLNVVEQGALSEGRSSALPSPPARSAAVTGDEVGHSVEDDGDPLLRQHGLENLGRLLCTSFVCAGPRREIMPAIPPGLPGTSLLQVGSSPLPAHSPADEPSNSFGTLPSTMSAAALDGDSQEGLSGATVDTESRPFKAGAPRATLECGGCAPSHMASCRMCVTLFSPQHRTHHVGSGGRHTRQQQQQLLGNYPVFADR